LTRATLVFFIAEQICLLLKTSSAPVLVEGCEFVAALLNSNYTPENAQRIVERISSIPKIEELPRHLFGPSFFKFKRAVEAASKLFTAILSLSAQVIILDGGENQWGSILVPQMLRETIDVLQENMKNEELTAETETPVSFCYALKVLIQMANVSGEITSVPGPAAATNTGHPRVFRQMTEWFKSFVQDVDAYLRKTIQGKHLVPNIPFSFQLRLLDVKCRC
jgi:hypothetical protein